MNENVPKRADAHAKILFVDSDEMMQIFFRDIFWVHGHDDRYHISVAKTLQEAQTAIANAETVPDVMFIDVMVPAEGGREASSSQLEASINFIKKIKADKKTERIKIIVFSGHKDDAFQRKVIALGASGYLVKGEFMPKEIIDFVDKLHS